MSRPRGGLGRGLAALIPTGPQTNVVSDVFMGGSGKRTETLDDVEAIVDADIDGSAADDRPVDPPDESTSPPIREARIEQFAPADGQPHRPSDDASNGRSTAQIVNVDATNATRLSGDSMSLNIDATTATSPSADGMSATHTGPHGTRSGQSQNGVLGGSHYEGPRYEELPITNIRRNPRNPRTVFDEDALAELEHSLREFGLLQPIVVREANDGYELVMGERRWMAAQRAGLATIPAIIRRTEDADLLRDALLENIHRANLNPLEEAAAYQQLLLEFDVTQEELAGRIGRSRPLISNTIRLLKLPIAVQRRVAAGVLSAGHARALLSLDDPSDQEELATRVVAEGLSVRGTEEAVVLMAGRTVRGRRSTPKKLVMPSLTTLAGALSDTFDTRVRVELGRQKGRLIVEFATVDDLERIVGIMAPAALDRSRNDLRNQSDMTDADAVDETAPLVGEMAP